MNMMTAIPSIELTLSRAEVAGLVALAARAVPPLWPLESAIAVNPLADFEDLPFEDAVRLGAVRFGARETLPLVQWRRLFEAGRIDRRSLRDVAIHKLGGLNEAFTLIGPNVSRLDLLMARLLDLDVDDSPARPTELAPDKQFIAKWCGAFFDQRVAANPMPNRQLGLYRAVLALAGHDPEYYDLAGDAGRALLLSVPRDPLDAIAEGLSAMGVAPGCELEKLASHVARLPGWAGHIRWRSEYADHDIAERAPAAMSDLIALWFLIERAGAISSHDLPPEPVDAAAKLAAHFGLSNTALKALPADGQAYFSEIASMSEGTLGNIFMTAAEWTSRNELAPQFRHAVRQPTHEDDPDAQLVFCIDVRSEPFRRAVEVRGRYETFGYAGFFGLPIALNRFDDSRRKRLLPVLLAPQHDVFEAALPGREDDAEAIASANAGAAHALDIFNSVKRGAATAFATAEAAGPLAGLLLAMRTLAPRLVGRIMSRRARKREHAFAPAIGASCQHAGGAAFTLEEKIGYATALFRLTGMSPSTARIVALVGHGGSAVNNPYAAALDCGACGGHAGGNNARILASILNDPLVRQGLAARGIAIPDSTIFIAGEHNTTTDVVTIFDEGAVPESHRGELASLKADLAGAGEANRRSRASLLGRTPEDLLAGAAHWGEVRPEWGLAGNATFIVGPRWLSKNIDLQGRAFLHSYDWREDDDNTALATILTAPMIVAQWINCQYLFSTIDNERYGSGDKVTQNIVGGIGVVQGNGGDLRVGLPRQSLFRDDGTPFHVPQRLLTVVLAPLEKVHAVVEQHDILRRLFGNGWVTLAVIDPATGEAHRWMRDDELDDGIGTDISFPNS